SGATDWRLPNAIMARGDICSSGTALRILRTGRSDDEAWFGNRLFGSTSCRARRTRAARGRVGDTDTILAWLAEYFDAGVPKFILRPLGGDDGMLAQTRSAPRPINNDTKFIAGHPGPRATLRGRERCESAGPCFSPTTRCRRPSLRRRWRT